MRAPDFWRGQGSAAALGCILSPLGWLYGAVTSWRAQGQPKWQAPVPVICVGNVVLGGAGKTVICLDLAKRLQDRKQTPHVILRGYGGRITTPTRVIPDQHTAQDVGDEALLLARLAPTWVGSDRADVAQHAVQAGASLIIMDDGFQNPSLHKDLSLLVIDGEYGLGNGYVFPAGPLREPLGSALKRADAIIILGGFIDVPGDRPVHRGSIVSDVAAPDLNGQRVIAFAGIGRPEKFFNTLKSCGADVIQTRSFDDHHPFKASDIEAILSEAKTNAARVITTEKDFVRVPENLRIDITPFPVRLSWENADAFERFLLEHTGLS